MQHNYITLSYVPSRYVPYPEKPDIKIRKLALGEVDYFYENSRNPKMVVDYFQEREIIKGIPLYDLTVDDWAFLELSAVALTWTNAKFNIDGGSCPQCGEGKVERLELGLDAVGNKKYLEVSSQLNTALVPADLTFNSLDEEVDWPIQLDLESGTANADFYRVSDYLDLYEEGNHRNVAKIIEKMIGIPREELAVEDEPILTYLYNKLSHGPNNEVPIKCPICSTIYRIRTEWDVSRFIPFRGGQSATGDRIHFGSRNAPASGPVKRPRISGRPELV